MSESNKRRTSEKHKKLEAIWDNFGVVFDDFWGAGGVPRGSQEASKNELENETIFDRFWKPLGHPLGSHVGPKWGP